jgi:hypothetical protein
VLEQIAIAGDLHRMRMVGNAAARVRRRVGSGRGGRRHIRTFSREAELSREIELERPAA